MDSRAWLRRIWRYLTSPAGIYLASSVLSKASVLFLVPLYTRKLTVQEFGDYGLAQTLASVAPLFLSLGTMSAVATFYFAETDVDASQRKSGGAARVCIALTVGLGLVAQIAISTFAPKLGGIGSFHLLTCVLWGGIGSFLSSIPAVYFRAQQRPIKAAVFQLFSLFAVITSAYILVVALHRGLAGAIEAMAVSGVATGLVGVGFTFFSMPGALDRAIWQKTLGFSLPFVPHFASMQVTSVSDRWVMKAAGHAIDLGSYSLAVTVTGPIGMVLSAWNEAESPRMGEAARTGGGRAIAARFSRTLLEYAGATLVPGLCLVLALPLLKIVVGERFSHDLWPIPVMLGLLVLESAFSPCINVFSFLHRTKIIPVITLSCAVFHLVLNVLLIPKLGTTGALLARGIAAVVRSSVLIWFAYDTFERAAHETSDA